MNEPSSNESSSGSGSVPSSTLMRGTRTYSAKPPGWKWVWRRVSQTEGWPCRQYRHSPQGTWWVTKTRSPTRKRVDPLADRSDLARDLVAEHERRRARAVPLHDVAAADPAGPHAQEHLAGPDARHRHLLDADVLEAVVHRDPHGPGRHGRGPTSGETDKRDLQAPRQALRRLPLHEDGALVGAAHGPGTGPPARGPRPGRRSAASAGSAAPGRPSTLAMSRSTTDSWTPNASMRRFRTWTTS